MGERHLTMDVERFHRAMLVKERRQSKRGEENRIDKKTICGRLRWNGTHADEERDR